MAEVHSKGSKRDPDPGPVYILVLVVIVCSMELIGAVGRLWGRGRKS